MAIPFARQQRARMGRPGFLRRIYPAFSARYMRARTDADRAARERAIATVRTPTGRAAVAGLWRSFSTAEHDLRAEAGALAAPTLVLWGASDRVATPDYGRALAAAIPKAQKMECHDQKFSSTPDPSIPMMAPEPATPAQMPTALLR